MRSLCLSLAGAACLLAAGASAGERMIGKSIGDTFSGMTLDGIYNRGFLFSETYFEDGGIRYHDINRSDSGEWSVRGDTFCTFYQDQPGACFVVERDGTNCFTFFEAIEGKDGVVSAAPQWTSRGWNRERQPTCPTPPETEI